MSSSQTLSVNSSTVEKQKGQPLRELGHYFFPSFIPLKPGTPDEFTVLLDEASLKGDEISIEIWTRRNSSGGAQTAAVGYVGTYSYDVELEATVGGKERIVFTKTLESRYGSDSGFADSDERAVASCRLVLSAVDASEKLQEKFPEATIAVKSSRGDITGPLLEKLRKDAVNHGIEPIPIW